MNRAYPVNTQGTVMKKHIVTTTLAGLLKALGMTVDDLRRDRHYAKIRGDEVIVLETKGGN
jgi:hypothetical protein